ncbi:MAG TPA: DUF4175 family protein [Polyangia bacterium]|jgi:hypothetical protein
MATTDRIHVFLGSLRRRLVLRAALRALTLGLTAILLMLLGLAFAAASFGPAGFWLPLTISLVGAGALGAVALGVWRPWRAVRGDARVAHVVGRLRPGLTTLSDELLTAVELAPRSSTSAATAEPSLISSALVHAFRDRLAETVAVVDAKQLISMRPVASGALAAVVSAAVVWGAAQISPQFVGRGLATLTHRPSRFEGAAVSLGPIVGDVRITYEYPPYTGLPPRTIEGSTGDVIAVKGTRVKIETTPLRRARGAVLLLGETGEAGELPVRIQKGLLTVHLTLVDSVSYRFWLQPLIGRAVRELRSHRLEAEADRPPRVEIHGPADRLELTSPRPIEVGFAADDDYGLGAIELVFRVDDGPEHRQPLKDPHGARLAEGRTLWDPSHLALSPGARIAYHVEARDRDEISGPKVGSSRTLYVVIARPQETVGARLDRQREILEHFIADLADRLEVTEAKPPSGERPSPASYTTLDENEEAHLTLLGRLLDDDRREGNLGKPLRAALAGIADRLGKLLREEKELLGKRTLAATRLRDVDTRHLGELEKSVLLMDDLIGRQRLEDLAAIGKELTDAHHRLQDLLTRYAATNDEALRRQLEREIRNLRARLADLAQKVAELKSRNDVGEEWQNLPDTRALAERAKRLDDLLAQGDSKAMGQALSDLGKDLQSLRQMLDENAEGFGAERFPQENRVVSDLMKKIGDLEGDERAVAGDTKALADKQDAETEKRLRDKLAEWTRLENDKIEKLKQKLGEVKTGGSESALSEEVERARENARQLKRLLGERDLAEAKQEADRAVTNLDRLTEHLDGDERPGRKETSPREKARASAARSVAEAQGLAQEISDDLRSLLPKPEETLSPEDRARAAAESERQNSIGDRTEETAREAARQLGKMPGLDRAADDLKAAAQQMREASQQLRRGDAKQASGAQQNAVERLAKLRDSLQERSSGGASPQHDPVRIPGADESQAPRAWRQELMDAMKEKAPEHFRDDVRRYYEELVR